MPDSTSWVVELTKRVPSFLEAMKGKKPGFYRYSWSGDVASESVHWGVGNTTFAAKILYCLDLITELSAVERSQMAAFINSFQNPQGYIFDPLVARRSWLLEKLIAIRSNDYNNFWHQQTKGAETRQAVSSLKLLNAAPSRPFGYFPKTSQGVESYLKYLDWTHPWGAASHFSHLLFFLHNSELATKQELITQTVIWTNQLQHAADGAWYKGTPSLQQKINGAMKVVTGFKVVNFRHTHHLTALIDLCLAATNDEHACDNFNIVYVLAYAHLQSPTYRTSEIKDFMFRRLQIYYDRHYYPDYGAFSFLPRQANKYYYGAKISRGKNEPDIHGTTLFLWGICMMAPILGLDQYLHLREFIP